MEAFLFSRKCQTLGVPQQSWGFTHYYYDRSSVGKEEVNQARNYLTPAMGRLAILCCNKKPNDGAHLKRNTIYSEERKVILFLTREELKEMLFIKERGEDPSDLIIDLIEWFYLQHE